MKKNKTSYVCTECGANSSKWQGQCAECGQWNTITEFRQTARSKTLGADQARRGYAGILSRIQTLDDIALEAVPRISSMSGEFDRVLGGGLVPGSAILIGGHPGAGKSTLLLQTSCHLAASKKVLYITGEESLQQVAMRASRLGVRSARLKMLAETSLERIMDSIDQASPDILVIDSIQVLHTELMESAPGSVSQVRDCAAQLTRMAKQNNRVVFLVGHVTKDGAIAGPKVLEHMIDCSLMLEGEQDSRYRTLRGTKNRFGAVNELGVFAMMENGLREVKNPSAIFLNKESKGMPGSVVTATWEGTRPLLVEIQALVDHSNSGYVKRVSVGLDQNRLAILLAVLHRHGGIACGDQDVFLNVVGGVRIAETGADLPALCAIVSSFRDRPLSDDLIVLGEIGLSGEIRPVSSGQERVYEAAKHGFTQAIVPAANMPRTQPPGIDIKPVKRLSEVLDLL